MGACMTCLYHGAQIRVDRVLWMVRCDECKWGRINLGDAPLTAETIATRHAIKRAHRVKLWCENTDHDVSNVRWISPKSKGQLSLDDIPPF